MKIEKHKKKGITCKMKTLAKILIIVLSILIVIQLIYFNIIKREKDKEKSETNNIENQIELNNNNEMESNIAKIEISENMFIPENFFLIERYYRGAMSSENTRQTIEKFVKEDVKKIREQTTGRSINYKLQYFDEHRDEIQQIGIYSADDYVEISRQINLVSSKDEFISIEIDRNIYEQTTDGYTKIKLILKYEENNKVEVYMYLANEESIVPNFKFSSK